MSFAQTKRHHLTHHVQRLFRRERLQHRRHSSLPKQPRPASHFTNFKSSTNTAYIVGVNASEDGTFGDEVAFVERALAAVRCNLAEHVDVSADFESHLDAECGLDRSGVASRGGAGRGGAGQRTERRQLAVTTSGERLV
jgi:hypothetical protein